MKYREFNAWESTWRVTHSLDFYFAFRFANNGNFAKAIGDFETALKINPGHVNARKYLGETLVARGRSLEEEAKYDDAIKSYEACLRIVPFHEEATNSIKYLKEKMEVDETDLTSSLPPLNISSMVNDVKSTLKQLLAEEKEKEGKKKKEKKKRKRQSSSSSSSSSSDDISSDSSDSSSSSDTSQDSSRKKKKKKKNKEKSLSPLSKRMAGSVQGNGLANRTYNPSSSSTNLMGIFDSVTAAAQPQKPTESEYDMRVTQFLEQTKGDNDYEEKVRKFLEETAKWKKEQRIKEKKKRKKEKKSKEKLKKKKREEKRKRKLEEKKLKEQANEFRAKTGLAALGVSELQSIQSKISEFYSRMNKPPSPTPVKKKDSVEKPSKKPKLDHSSSSSDEATGGDKSPPRASKTGASNVKRSSNSKRAETPQGKQATRPRSRSSSGDRKKVDIFADSPSPQSKDRTEALSGSKFKMQINSNKIKKDTKTEKEVWSNDEDGEDDRDRDGRHYNEKKKERSPPPPKVMNVGVDKLGGFRINLDAAMKKKKRDSAGRDSDSESPRKRKPRRRDSRSSTRSRSKKRSSSRSSSSSYYNKRSYRKRNHSSDSRSRSRSRSYSHSRSRSYSPHGSRRLHRGGMARGGTYYKPRPYYHNTRGGYVPRGRGRGGTRGYDSNYRGGGRGNYVPRGRGGYNQNYNNGHSRPRYFHYKSSGRDPRDSGSYYSNASVGRYDKRPRSPRDDHDESPMRKVNAEKQRIDRMIEKHPSGPLSEV
ncbi:hypothetical protein M8J76_001972 [Diaphorina citri]|nr:hypothetical protein M8J76_001972 [Diaphorina citri]